MEDQSAQASKLIDGVELEISEDMVHLVKGTVRPELDENEEEDSTSVAEQGSVLSDFEDEDYVSEAVVGSVPLVISEGEETSLRRDVGKVNNRIAEVLASPEQETSFEEAPPCVDHNVHREAASLLVSSSLTVDRDVAPWQAFPETNFLSESDEDVLCGPTPVATVQVEPAPSKYMKGALGEGPVHSVRFVPEDSFTSPSSGALTVEQNNQPLQTSFRTNKFSDNGEDITDLNSGAKVHSKHTSDMAEDAFGASVSKAAAGVVVPCALASPKHDHVVDVMSRLGSEPGQNFGSEDSKSSGRLDVMETTRRKGTIMRLGSKEAEELLQLDLSKLGRAVLPSVTRGGAGVKSPHSNGGGWGVEDLGPDELSRYVERLEVKETYLDTVLDMEDVLLDSDDNHRPHSFQSGNSMFPKPVQRLERDGTLTASTSGIPLATNRLVEVAWAEVVGARQRRGGASLSERVVGVKEHTVYQILVRGTDGQEWDVERRYRDFVFLYQQLNRTFPAGSAVTLPAPWDRVKLESRKLFGNTSPNVVEVRSALITVCLQSLLQAGPPLSTASPFLRFLFPTTWSATQSAILPRVFSDNLRASGSHVSRDESGSETALSPMSDRTGSSADRDMDTNPATQSVFGKTIRLKLEIQRRKPLAQQMQSQHHSCAGCYRPLNFSVGLIPGLAQSFGLSGPRWCDYSGQLYCSACHLNETAVIPAHVVQHWNFGLRPVSQLAKAYLDSIYDKPMLCVSAVNPYLYVRVPVLVHLRETRKRLSKMLACIRCPSRARIQGMVGSRRYLLERNDFYALRDLIDLAKGAFAVVSRKLKQANAGLFVESLASTTWVAGELIKLQSAHDEHKACFLIVLFNGDTQVSYWRLPIFVNTLSEKLTSHIKRDCSICREMGDLCAAGNFCRDPLDMIFPFQEDGVVRCVICHLPFHKSCFKLIKFCPSCSGGAPLDIVETLEAPSTSSASNVVSSTPSSSNTSVAPDASVQVDAIWRMKMNLPAFLSGILTAKDSSSREANPGRQDSVVLDMMSGPLEL